MLENPLTTWSYFFAPVTTTRLDRKISTTTGQPKKRTKSRVCFAIH